METNTTNMYLHQFNETIDKWIGYLNDYSLEMLCQSPQTGSWSLGQVYVHIINDTNYFVEQIKAALFTSDNSEMEMHEHGKAMFANNGFPDVMIEGPSTNVYIPQPENKEKLLQDLSRIKEEINQLAATYDFSQSNGKTRHPGLHFFTSLEWLRFAEMHMRHHLRQKKRIDAAHP
jgi:hypothetical protein